MTPREFTGKPYTAIVAIECTTAGVDLDAILTAIAASPNVTAATTIATVDHEPAPHYTRIVVPVPGTWPAAMTRAIDAVIFVRRLGDMGTFERRSFQLTIGRDADPVMTSIVHANAQGFEVHHIHTIDGVRP